MFGELLLRRDPGCVLEKGSGCVMGEKAERTKEAILWEAGRLFAEKGFKEVTMSDICERTGLSRGGLYRYYSGTGQIFSEILSRQYTVSERLERRESARVILEDMLRNLEEEILEKDRSLSLAIYESMPALEMRSFLSVLTSAPENGGSALLNTAWRQGSFDRWTRSRSRT